MRVCSISGVEDMTAHDQDMDYLFETVTMLVVTNCSY